MTGFKKVYALGFQAPGGFTLQIALDGTHDIFRLTDRNKSVVDHPALSTVSQSGDELLITFDSLINQDPAQPCHVELRIRIAEKPYDNAASWLVVSPFGTMLMDSHNSLGNSGGWVKGNSGIRLTVE